MKKVNKIIIGVLTILMVGGCSDILDVPPYGNVTPETFFTNEKDATLAVIAAYATTIDAVGWWAKGFDAYGEYQSDDLASAGWYDDFLFYTYGDNGESQGITNGVWGACYAGIAQCNATIEGVESMMDDQISVASRNAIIAEAKFLRGWWHLRLAQLYGNAPIILKIPTAEDELYPPSATSDQLIAAAVTDFTAASAHLPVSYEDSQLGRATKGAASAYQAWAEMYLENWSNALSALDGCIATGVYELVDYTHLWHENYGFNNEVIFETGINGDVSERNWRPYYYGQGDGKKLTDNHGKWNIMTPSPSLIAEYEPNDPRLDYTFWIDGEVSPANGRVYVAPADSSRTGYEVQKGSVYYESNFSKPSMNQTWMRYADVLLMKAECLNELGRTGEANEWVNMVRQRVGVDMPPIDVVDQVAMREAIIHERRIEFAMEGRRAYDIRRWGIESETLAKMPGSQYTGKYKYVPVPKNELEKNPNLIQAPGW